MFIFQSIWKITFFLVWDWLVIFKMWKCKYSIVGSFSLFYKYTFYVIFTKNWKIKGYIPLLLKDLICFNYKYPFTSNRWKEAFPIRARVLEIKQIRVPRQSVWQAPSCFNILKSCKWAFVFISNTHLLANRWSVAGCNRFAAWMRNGYLFHNSYLKLKIKLQLQYSWPRQKCIFVIFILKLWC